MTTPTSNLKTHLPLFEEHNNTSVSSFKMSQDEKANVFKEIPQNVQTAYSK